MQEQIDELVERFYARLVQDSYYSRMFVEKKVDLDVLKQRQKVFIARLVHGGALQEDQDEVKQVQERHFFGIDPQRAETWLQHMMLTMEEMGLAPGLKDPLLDKMQFLINKMIEKQSTDLSNR